MIFGNNPHDGVNSLNLCQPACDRLAQGSASPVIMQAGGQNNEANN